MKWGEVETGKFVKIYVKHENLWNPRSLHYKVREQRLKSYRQIIAQFKSAAGISLTLSELTSKIKALRCTYILELGKIIKRARTGSTYKTRIKWFSDMHECLKDVAKPRKMDLTLISSIPFDDIVRKEWDPDNVMESDSNEGQRVWVPNRLENDGDNDSDNFLSQNGDLFSQINKDKVKVKIENVDDTFKTKRKKIKRHSSSTDQSFIDSNVHSDADSKTIEDEFDIYGKYIASQLRSLDLQKALTIKLQIQGLVSEARISELRQNQ